MICHKLDASKNLVGLIHFRLWTGGGRFAMTGQAGFFDVDERLQRLSDLGDQLEAYAATVDFEIFRAPLEAALTYADGLKAPAAGTEIMNCRLVVIGSSCVVDDLIWGSQGSRGPRLWFCQLRARRSPRVNVLAPDTDLRQRASD
jgi:hypothetical protein